MRAPAAAAVVAVLLGLSGCGGPRSGAAARDHTVLIAVNAPFSQQSALGDQIANGAELVAGQLDAHGGIRAGATRYRVRVKRYDDALSPATAVQNVRHAIADGAAAILDEGTGVDASWKIAEAAHVPVFVVHQGGAGLVDPHARPNVFRIVPTDQGLALRYAEYLDRIHVRPAILHDDSPYGAGGAAALRRAFDYSPKAVADDILVSQDAADLSAPVLRARRSGANGLLVWGGPGTVAEAVRAARAAGWEVPVYGPPDAADPLVRQELSRHPDWVDGLTFADGRLTAEVGPAPFESYVATYDAAFGADRVGVRDAAGRPVTEPPEYGMYASDFVNLLAAAIERARGVDGRRVLAALEQVTIRGANGDERGFNVNSHEGVVDDDVYFAVFDDMRFRPVKDEPLSATLPAIPQVAPG
jgi:ABC-type branched-subunit amino acid transport system substrate-binding protein